MGIDLFAERGGTHGLRQESVHSRSETELAIFVEALAVSAMIGTWRLTAYPPRASSRRGELAWRAIHQVFHDFWIRGDSDLFRVGCA